MKVDGNTTLPTPTILDNTFLVSVILCYLYVFMEWLFLVSKPSYLANLVVLEHLNILMLA